MSILCVSLILLCLLLQETDLSGLQNLIKFYKSRRFDEDIGLPRYDLSSLRRVGSINLTIQSIIVWLITSCSHVINRPNDFHDVPEYFVLEVMQWGRNW